MTELFDMNDHDPLSPTRQVLVTPRSTLLFFRAVIRSHGDNGVPSHTSTVKDVSIGNKLLVIKTVPALSLVPRTGEI
jgi:hypothetical protein